MTNAEIVRNPHLPYGWRRDGPMESLLLYDTQHRLVVASRTRPVALATNVAVFTFQCHYCPVELFRYLDNISLII